MTDAERKLSYMLRDRRFAAAKFRRQVLSRYVANFFSFERQVVVEVDGGQHSAAASDLPRDDWFRSQFRVVRLWNNDVLTNLRGVFTLLSDTVEANTPHPASQQQAAAMPPSPTRGEGKRRAR